jgi:PAS domain-containing protein
VSDIQNHKKEIAGGGDGLNQSEPCLPSFIDSIPAIAGSGVSLLSPEYWNKRWPEYTGLSVEASRGSGWQNALHPEDREELLEKWCSRFETEARLRRFDGIYRVLFRSDACRDVHGGKLVWDRY